MKDSRHRWIDFTHYKEEDLITKIEGLKDNIKENTNTVNTLEI